METLEVRRHHARYHLPRSRAGERGRLDRVLRDAMDGYGVDGPAGTPIGAREEVCIRHLDVSVRVRLGRSDQAIAEIWRAGMERTIRDTVERGGTDVVRYPSRGDAFVDLASGVIGEDLTRAWAWRRLGIWSGGPDVSSEGAARQLVRSLLAEAELIVPTIVALADGGLAAPFLRVVSGDLPRLARAAVRVADGDALVVDVAGRDDVPRAGYRAEVLRTDGPAAAAFGAQGALADAAVATISGPDRPAERRAIAALIAVAADPGSMRSGARAADLVDGIVAMLESVSEMRDLERAAKDEARASAAPGRTGVVQRDPAPAVSRATGTTAAGGLLYLLWIVADLGLPDELATAPEFANRTLRWWLHQLGLAVAEVGPDDPAALAFAGLPPTAAPPGRAVPPGPDDRTALTSLADRVGAALAERLEWPTSDPHDMLASVCARAAEIVADPGWLEVTFALDAVDLDIRRAGLDLDPGYLPWLGTVVRFRYV